MKSIILLLLAIPTLIFAQKEIPLFKKPVQIKGIDTIVYRAEQSFFLQRRDKERVRTLRSLEMSLDKSIEKVNSGKDVWQMSITSMENELSFVGERYNVAAYACELKYYKSLQREKEIADSLGLNEKRAEKTKLYVQKKIQDSIHFEQTKDIRRLAAIAHSAEHGRMAWFTNQRFN